MKLRKLKQARIFNLIGKGKRNWLRRKKYRQIKKEFDLIIETIGKGGI